MLRILAERHMLDAGTTVSRFLAARGINADNCTIRVVRTGQGGLPSRQTGQRVGGKPGGELAGIERDEMHADVRFQMGPGSRGRCRQLAVAVVWKSCGKLCPIAV
jgi:hypothetical protein